MKLHDCFASFKSAGGERKREPGGGQRLSGRGFSILHGRLLCIHPVVCPRLSSLSSSVNGLWSIIVHDCVSIGKGLSTYITTYHLSTYICSWRRRLWLNWQRDVQLQESLLSRCRCCQLETFLCYFDCVVIIVLLLLCYFAASLNDSSVIVTSGGRWGFPWVSGLVPGDAGPLPEVWDECEKLFS